MSLFVEVRGAGGSGKSTVARKVAMRYSAARRVLLEEPLEFDTLKEGRLVWYGNGAPLPVGTPGKFKPGRLLGYTLTSPLVSRPLFLLGSYETECGGGDTFPQMDLIYAVSDMALDAGSDVLQEGRILSNASILRGVARKDRAEVLVVHLDRTVEECVASTLERRGGCETPEKLASITKNVDVGVRCTVSSANRYRAAGVEVISVKDRDEAANLVIDRLGLTGVAPTTLEALGIGTSPARRPAKKPEPEPALTAAPPVSLDLFEPADMAAWTRDGDS